MSISVVTEGTDLPSEAYELLVDGRSIGTVAANSLTGIPIAPAGRRAIRLGGLPPNCSGAGDAVAVTVQPEATTDVAFRITCVPSAANLTVITKTTGVDSDIDGFRLMVDDVDYGGLPANGLVSVVGVHAGPAIVRLQNVAANCGGGFPVALNLTHGETYEVGFTLQCAPSEASIRVTTSTVGLAQDPDGYLVHLSDRVYSVPPSGSVVITGVPADNLVLLLAGVASNCTTQFPLRALTLSRGTEGNVRFDVRCASYSSDIVITTATTGVDTDADGYEVLQYGSIGEINTPYADASPFPVPSNGVARREDLEAGTTAVLVLTRLQPNCQPRVPNPIVLALRENTEHSVRFDVDCVESGRARITVTQVGEGQDRDGYQVEAMGFSHTKAVIPNGSVMLPGLLAGERRLRLIGLNQNCLVMTENPVAVTITAGETAEVAYTVHCVSDPGVSVAVSALGLLRDPDGFQLLLQRGAHRIVLNIPPDGATGEQNLMLPDVGEWTATLLGISANCDALPAAATQKFTGGYGSVSRIAFSVSCSPPSQLAFAMVHQSDWDVYTILSDGSGLTNLTRNPSRDVHPAFSSQGRIAFASDRTGTLQVYAMDGDGGNLVRITHSNANNHSPTWSPDGARIAYVSDRTGVEQIFVIDADGTDDSQLTDNAPSFDPAWSPDGSLIAFVSIFGSSPQLYIWHTHGMATRHASQGNTRYPSWAPDSRGIAASVELCDYYYGYGCHRGLGLTALDSNAFVWYHDPVAQSSWSSDGARIAVADNCGPTACTQITVLRVGPPSRPAVVISGDAVAHPTWRR
jgi:hypothetical protein